MKIKISLFYIASLLLLNCGNQIDENELIGKWEISEFIANTNQLSPALIEDAKTEALSTSFLFEKDKTCSMKSNFFANGKVGKYEFIPETSIIKIRYSTTEDNSTEQYKVESLSASIMKWTQDLGEFGSLSLTLTKEKN